MASSTCRRGKENQSGPFLSRTEDDVRVGSSQRPSAPVHALLPLRGPRPAATDKSAMERHNPISLRPDFFPSVCPCAGFTSQKHLGFVTSREQGPTLGIHRHGSAVTEEPPSTLGLLLRRGGEAPGLPKASRLTFLGVFAGKDLPAPLCLLTPTCHTSPAVAPAPL